MHYLLHLLRESEEVGKGNQCFANRGGREVADRNSVVKIGHLPMEKKQQPHCPLEASVITELQIHNKTLAKLMQLNDKRLFHDCVCTRPDKVVSH